MNLELNNISFAYPKNNHKTFDNLSLHIQNKSITSIMGASGSGKSTLLRLICGLETPQTGSIILNNDILVHDTINIPTEQRNIGMVFQNYILFPHMTVEQNINYGLDNIKTLSKTQKKERCTEILTLTEMFSHKDSYPNQLSGGQQQRVALGRALAPMPRLLLLDEPFSNLDSFLKTKIRNELKQILEVANIQTILVTHSTDDLSISDHIILLGQSEIRSGTLEELRAIPTCPLVKNLIFH